MTNSWRGKHQLVARNDGAGWFSKFFSDRSERVDHKRFSDVSGAVGPLLEGYLAQRAEDASVQEDESLASRHSVVLRSDAVALADAALSGDDGMARAICDELVERGADWTDISVDLFQEAFVVFGDRWGADTASFASITAASVALQGLYRVLAAEEDARRGVPTTERRALLVSASGGQHTFGAVMVGELLRKAGWDVVEHDPLDGSAGVQTGATWFDLIGFSVSRQEDLTSLEKCISDVRRLSRNQGVAIMVGGAAFVNHPNLASTTTADAVAVDGRDAVRRASVLWSGRGERMESAKRG